MRDDFDSYLDTALNLGVDLRHRRIFLQDDVSKESIALVIRGLYYLPEGEPIRLFVSSYGGSLHDAFALHDVIRTLGSPVHTIAIGKCMSAAPLLVACGEKGERRTTPNTCFMLHDAHLDSGGRPKQVEQEAALTGVMMDRYSSLLGRYTLRDRRFWRRIFDDRKDRYFTADEALEWGVVDGIWEEKSSTS